MADAVSISSTTTTSDGGPPAKRRCVKPDYRKLLKVLVGAKEEAFFVYEDAICKKSRFFRAACSEQWMGEQPREVKLPNEKTKHFKNYLYWIYTGDADFEIGSHESTSRTAVLSAYLLGDRVDDLGYRNYAMNRLIALFAPGKGALPCVENIALVYDHTPPGSKLRKVLVSCYVARIGRAYWCRTASRMHPDFVVDVSIAAMSAVPLISYTGWAQRREDFMEAEEEAVQ